MNIPKKDHNDSWSNRLKLADGDVTKEMILDLVNSHGKAGSAGEYNDLEVNDIVAEKGEGLVMLLYGKKRDFITLSIATYAGTGPPRSRQDLHS